MVPIVYSPRYNITAFGLERLHPFDGRKYGRIHDWLVRQGIRSGNDFIAPSPLSNDYLLQVHTSAYLRSLRSARVLAGILEVPPIRFLPACFTDWQVLRPMRLATGGTVLACRLALTHGLGINLGGGYHHAGKDKGGGFCIYADIPLALAILKRDGQIASALVVDTDAHQGNGTADAIRDWGWAHQLDLYEEDLFPWPKVEEDMPVAVPMGTAGVTYLDMLSESLTLALDRFRPDLVVYNAGSDVLQTDPLGRLCLTKADMADRDLFVVTEVRKRGVPLAMVLSGGYGPDSWLAHAESIESILVRFDREV